MAVRFRGIALAANHACFGVSNLDARLRLRRQQMIMPSGVNCKGHSGLGRLGQQDVSVHLACDHFPREVIASLHPKRVHIRHTADRFGLRRHDATHTRPCNPPDLKLELLKRGEPGVVKRHGALEHVIGVFAGHTHKPSLPQWLGLGYRRVEIARDRCVARARNEAEADELILVQLEKEGLDGETHVVVVLDSQDLSRLGDR
mmetsp:Transcript_41577/g.83352  ORF Transcript_41577/g.83352 Transcript_41577/m.83352 type:complete len:202 (-) Transcript_41577:919-1524(-)